MTHAEILKFITYKSYLTNKRTTEQELNRGKEKLSQMNSALEQEKETCNNSIQQYQSQLNEINAELNSLESGDKICPSDIITPSAPLYKQIFNSHAQEMVWSIRSMFSIEILNI